MSAPTLTKATNQQNSASPDKPKPTISIRMIVLLLVLLSLAFYAYRRTTWQSAIKKIEDLQALRGDRKALQLVDDLEKSWGRTAESHFLRARSLRHLDRISDFQSELNRAAIKGYDPAMVTHEQRLEETQIGLIDRREGSLEALLTNTSAPFSENADALVKGLMVQNDISGITQALFTWQKVDPGSHWISFYGGILSFRENAFEDAIKLFQKTYEKEPNFIPLFFQFG